MTTFGDLLEQRKRQQQQPATTVGDMIAARDRAFEAEAIRPPALDENDQPIPKPENPAPAAYFIRNPRPEPAPTVTDDLARNLQIGTQGVGRGIAGVLGLPVDLMETVLNAAAGGANLAGADVPYLQGSVGGGESIANAAGSGVESLFGDVLIDKADMTPEEKIRYAANQYGTEGAVGGGVLNKLRGVLPRGWTAPYEAAGSETRVIAGDAAAGAGSGVAMQAYENAGAPFGVVGQLIAGLLGGVGGAGVLGAVERTADAGRNVARTTRSVPENVLPRDPETMMPVMEGDLRRAAALYQDKTFNVDEASRNIEAYLADVAEPGAPNPTTGLIADDPGLLSAERRMRTLAPEAFIQRDRDVMGDVSDRVNRVRPEGADPQAARDYAASSIEELLERSRQRVETGQGAVNEQEALLDDLGQILMSRTGMQDETSRWLDRILVDETYIPAREQKNLLYDDAASDPNVVVGTENTRARAEAERDRIDRANPALRDTRSRGIADAFTFPEGEASPGVTLPSTDTTPDARVVRPLGDVMEDRRALSTIESESRAKGDFGRADTARNVRSGINEDVRAAAESGVPGTEKLAKADTNYRERFAPFFREGNAAQKFFKDIDTDPKRSRTPPEATANRFLIAGPNSAAAAEDVARIIEIAPDPQSGKDAVREYIMADAVSKGVVDLQTGRIRENQLAAFMNARTGMFDQFPEMKAQFDALLGNVRAGREELGELSADLRAALDEAALTERDIRRGALQLVVDAEPRKAVQGVFSRPDSVAAMREVVTGLRDNPEAAEGWKAAVADYFVDKVTTASKAAVRNDQDTVSLPALRRTFEQNRDALAEVFTPEEMSDLQQVQSRLEILSNRGAQASTGSATAENLGPLGNMIRDLAKPAGLVTLVTRGALLAGSVERRIKGVAEQFGNSDANAEKLIMRATFDPEVARLLLSFPTDGEQVYEWSKKLNRAIVFSSAADEEGDAE